MSLKHAWTSFGRKYLTAKTVTPPPVLLFWWGSYGFKGGPTLGDLLAVNNLSSRLGKLGLDHAVVSHTELKFSGHLLVDDVYAIRPARKFVFVCGPITENRELGDLLSIHRAATKIAAGVSVLANHAKMNRRFDRIVGRDGSDPSHFDLAVAETVAPIQDAPLKTAGICLRGPQDEYGADRKGMSLQAEAVFREIMSKNQLQPVVIDTVLSAQNDAAMIDANLQSSDIIMTTRMHGALLALAAGKPVIAIDQVPGGAKVTAVIEKTGWPYVFKAEAVSAEAIQSVLDRLRSSDWRPQVLSAQKKIRELTDEALKASVDAISL